MRTCILVLGMHRSGTSAVAGCLHRCGIPMGRKLLWKKDDNPKGHYEPVRIYRLNRFILWILGSRWDRIRFTCEELKSHWLFDWFVRLIVRAIKKEYKGFDIFGIKDPRICVLLPIYTQAFKMLGIHVKHLVVDRDSQDIVSSLRRRNGMSCDCANRLMSKYAYFLGRNEKMDSYFISYDVLMRDPAMALLGLNLKIRVNMAEVCGFLGLL